MLLALSKQTIQVTGAAHFIQKITTPEIRTLTASIMKGSSQMALRIAANNLSGRSKMIWEAGGAARKLVTTGAPMIKIIKHMTAVQFTDRAELETIEWHICGRVADSLRTRFPNFT